MTYMKRISEDSVADLLHTYFNHTHEGKQILREDFQMQESVEDKLWVVIDNIRVHHARALIHRRFNSFKKESIFSNADFPPALIEITFPGTE
jgi:hypothetical protein